MNKPSFPFWLNTYLTPDAIERISQSVAAAEQKTSGEIVPMIVRRSSAIGHIPALITLVALSIILIAFEIITRLNHSASEFRATSHLVIAATFISIVTVGVGLWISRLPLIQRKLIHKFDRKYQVQSRAELEFYRQGLDKTVGATGILLFVSVMEHIAIVLADKAIAEKVPQQTWNDVIQILLGGLKKGSMEQGFNAAITRCGDILAPHFPRLADDTNELHDRLIISE